MAHVHVGLRCSTVENADAFYRDLLHLEKAEPKRLPAELSRAAFGIDLDLTVINYTDEATHFEVFIVAEQSSGSALKVEHTCLRVDDVDGLLTSARSEGFPVLQIPKGDSYVTFIADLDGNRFEIKA